MARCPPTTRGRGRGGGQGDGGVDGQDDGRGDGRVNGRGDGGINGRSDGRGGGRGDRQGGGREDGHDDAHNDARNDDTPSADVSDASVPCKWRPRGQSLGPTRRPAGTERKVCMLGKNSILLKKARTCFSVTCREHYKDFMPHWKDITNDWIKSVMREFYLCFRFPNEKQLFGEKISKGYMKGWSKWHYHWRCTALKAAGIRGNRDCNEQIRAYRPGWCSEDVWDELCNHWAKSDFKDASKQHKGARLASKMTHTGGSMLFEQHEDLAEELKSQPRQMDLFERTHKRKSKEGQYGKGPWIREYAENIYKNYKDPFSLPSSSNPSENVPSQEERMQAQQLLVEYERIA